MFRILIVTHGQFGRELLRSAELIVGKQDNIDTLGLEHGECADELGEKVFNWIVQRNQEGNNALVLTDLFGGTPTNVTLANMHKLDFKCITGVNLPMLIEIINNSDVDLDSLVEFSSEVGRKGIRVIDNSILKKKS
ncbi:MAG: PTS mannose transporter subunit IIAB [Oscillospiraceae bacterium]|nr:PTS mannose transporter subunit IIAB [Oscillospiraceae bacterium]